MSERMSVTEYRKRLGFANRGMRFQDEVDEQNRVYQSRGIATVVELPTPMKIIRREMGGRFITVFSEKSKLDFIGVANAIPITFDAKETKGYRFPIGNIKQHQIEFCESFENTGGIAFFLVRFSDHGLTFVLPFRSVEHLSSGKKSINLDRFIVSCKQINGADYISYLIGG